MTHERNRCPSRWSLYTAWRNYNPHSERSQNVDGVLVASVVSALSKVAGNAVAVADAEAAAAESLWGRSELQLAVVEVDASAGALASVTLDGRSAADLEAVEADADAEDVVAALIFQTTENLEISCWNALFSVPPASISPIRVLLLHLRCISVHEL